MDRARAVQTISLRYLIEERPFLPKLGKQAYMYLDTIFVSLLDQRVPIVYEPQKIAPSVITHSSHKS